MPDIVECICGTCRKFSEDLDDMGLWGVCSENGLNYGAKHSCDLWRPKPEQYFIKR
jgi:hypothetical protein